MAPVEIPPRKSGASAPQQDNHTFSHKDGRFLSRPPRSTYSDSIEHGRICSLKENFGFIFCADRPEEVFFHFSEVIHGCELKLGDEVEFSLLLNHRSQENLRARQVRKLDPGTVVWEVEVNPGFRYQGLVKKLPQRNQQEKAKREGVIDIISETEYPEKRNDDLKLNDETTVFFTFEELTAIDRSNSFSGRLVSERDFQRGNSNLSSSSRNANGSRLARHDIVEFSIFKNRRTNFLYAKCIKLIQSDQEKKAQSREAELLAAATLEQGIITALKHNFGFLRSNKRQDEIYFHFDNIELDEKNDAENKLEIGMEVEFLVVKEEASMERKEKISARKVRFLPKGTVQFEITVAVGVTGVVVRCPFPRASHYSTDANGIVQLSNTITYQDNDSEELIIQKVSFHAKDSPGGLYSYKEGSAALWIREGDTLLFDVVKKCMDGSFHVAPTKRQVGNIGDEEKEPSAVKLVSCALALRQEGTIHVIKEQFGFISLSERMTESYFRTQDLFPRELQRDLLFGMGISDPGTLEMTVGVDVQFDLVVQSETSQAKKSKQRGVGEKENLRARRILLLPMGTIVPVNHILAHDVKGIVIKEDQKQSYAGIIELEQETQSMSLEDRHPLASRLIRSLQTKLSDSSQFIFPDVQSKHDDIIIQKLVSSIGGGSLQCSSLPSSNADKSYGRLIISKVASSVGSDEIKINDTEHESPDGSHEELSVSVVGKNTDASDCQNKLQRGGVKVMQQIRYDKSSLVRECREGGPPQAGDVVRCDVLQSRRSGVIYPSNLCIEIRSSPSHSSEIHFKQTQGGIGIVLHMDNERQIGFISVLDDLCCQQEVVHLHLNSLNKENIIVKGSVVKFKILSQKGGKRIAENVEILPPESCNIHHSFPINISHGIIVIEPSRSLPIHSNNSPPKRTVEEPKSAGVTKGRWANVDLSRDIKKSSPPKKEGIIFSTNIVMQSVDLVDNASSNSSTEMHQYWKYSDGVVVNHELSRSGTMFHDKSVTGPRRGDLVCFAKTKNGKGARDILLLSRGAAILLKGHLEQISLNIDSNSGGSAVFVSNADNKESFVISLSEVLSCETSRLVDGEEVEGLLHDGKIFGVYRTKDLYLDSKIFSNSNVRTKLNLTVKKNLGGKIVAQSMMAKGPDGTVGFHSGWTTRVSKYGN
jgi:cold shock CspA family protein